MHSRSGTLALGFALVAAATPSNADPTAHEFELTIGYSSEPVVSMGDVVITHADLDAHMQQLPEESRTQAVSSMERIDSLLQSILLQEALMKAAVDAGLLEDSANAASARYAAAADLSQRQMQKQIQSQLLESYEQRGRELFLSQPELFATPPTYSFTHVLIGTDKREEAEAMSLILEVHERVQGGEEFDGLVREYSEDMASEAAGGKYTKTPLSNLDRNFARALRELEQTGDISGPVRSRFGWHLIRLDARHEAPAPEWEDVEDQAVKKARQDHRERIRKAYVAELLNEDAIEVVPGSIEQFQKRYGYERDMVEEAGSDR